MTGPAPDTPHLGAALAARRADGGVVLVWCSRLDERAAFTHQADRTHYAASLIKPAVLRAAHRNLDLGERVLVHDRFPSVVRGHYRVQRADDNDEVPWERLGAHMTLGRLCHRMIRASSNLATSLVVEAVGLPAVAACAPPGLVVTRPIGDRAAIEAGLTNTVTAAAAGALLAGAAGDTALLAPYREQEYRDGIPAALPAGVQVANKNAWVDGVEHDAALIEPADAPPYVLAVCTTGLAPEHARAAIHAVTRASWADRHSLGRHSLGPPAGQAGPPLRPR
ncbi:serine hydrolase [Streptomyces montanisoli]|uniref:Serine hydrolase n=1 Tax=Streptomyces montanisoli TaxID=2798581 RepID=A0A940RTQ8_9ACTN|nr:serine hydrolase [Streptomyces montanisoli]MBP0457147.1 serine hydrolase [Streptomyces montanisoli]